jgi:hypothetical protein
MKFSTRQEKSDLLIQVTAWAGLTVLFQQNVFCTTRLTVCEYCDTMEPVIHLTTCYICIYIMCTFV